MEGTWSRLWGRSASPQPTGRPRAGIPACSSCSTLIVAQNPAPPPDGDRRRCRLLLAAAGCCVATSARRGVHRLTCCGVHELLQEAEREARKKAKAAEKAAKEAAKAARVRALRRCCYAHALPPMLPALRSLLLP